MNLKDVKIVSKRLIQVPINKSYAESLYKNFTDEVTKYMYPTPSENIEGVHAFISNATTKINNNTDLYLAILDNETNEHIGGSGLHHIGDKDPEIGIWLKKSAHGNGYGLEAVNAIIQWARENISFEYIKYPVDKRNIASKRIPELNNGKLVKEYDTTTDSGKTLHLVEYWIY
ncbi:GNAT family N-acetyltransferase [Clostridiaceae bacterium M8S5]|nr:GNAT family N-acetyltransferase [Clostridiaceae bacterium M8S5]